MNFILLNLLVPFSFAAPVVATKSGRLCRVTTLAAQKEKERERSTVVQ